MGKPTIGIGDNKGADQLRSNCEADQRLCFRFTDSTIPLLYKSKTSRLCSNYPSGSRCMLLAGQVRKISCPPVAKRVINLPYDPTE